MKLSPKDYAIIALSLLCIAFGYIAFNRKVSVQDTFSEHRLDSINVENNRLNEVISKRDAENLNIMKMYSDLLISYDSLEKSKKTYIHDIKLYENYKSSDIKSSADSMRNVLSKIGVH